MTDKSTYPKITRKIWWLLRGRLKQSMPTSITPTLVSSVSQMSDDSARANVIGPLRELSLIDDKNKPTELMERWRHDDEYANVCQEIRSNIYPHELIEAFPSPTPEQEDRIKAWFMKNAKVGDGAARMYTTTYVLLSQGDPSKANEIRTKSRGEGSSRSEKTTSPRPKAAPRIVPPAGSDKPDSEEHASKGSLAKRNLPSIHIDVQVHISPDTSSEQIDKIFESMSKHLTKFIG
jgi:hypothetical protein